MAAMVAVGLWLAKLTKGKVPALIVIIVIGAYITSPWFPGATWVLETSASVNFLSVITLMLAIAGLSIGKDLPMLKGIGWKIIPVGIVAIVASFLMAAKKSIINNQIIFFTGSFQVRKAIFHENMHPVCFKFIQAKILFIDF